jgi:hypothetical protein
MTDAATLEQLRRDLAIVISAEAVLTLTDLYGLDSEAVVASVVHTARLITRATLGPMRQLDRSRPPRTMS